MKFGSLFSGIGGLDLGLERAGMECRWQVENSEWCNRVLAKHWPDIPRYGDIKEVEADALEPVDVVAGGFPCQPFSHAGRRTAQGDDRYLWPEMLRVIRELKPRFVLAENVYGLVTIQQGLVLETVYLDLEDAGYEVAPPVVFPAAAVGALHRRDRVWIMAHSKGDSWRFRDGDGKADAGARVYPHARHDERCPEQGVEQEERPEVADRVRADAAHADLARLEGRERGVLQERPSQRPIGACGTYNDSRAIWEFEPDVGRVANGVPRRVDRLRGLGNAVVPQAAEIIGRMLMASASD